MPDTPPSWRDRLAAARDSWWPGSSSPPAPVLVAAGVLVAVVVVVALLRPAPTPPELTLPRAVPGGAEGGDGGGVGPEADGPVYVHVAGAVVHPGVYRVRAEGRVADVVDAAGGPSPDADLDQLNLAAKLSDGERVYVPRRGETVPPELGGVAAGGGSGTGAGPSVPIDLNTATLEQLVSLPGVGPATARAILEHRKARGRFKRIDELLEVRGIGEAKLAAIRSRVRV